MSTATGADHERGKEIENEVDDQVTVARMRSEKRNAHEDHVVTMYERTLKRNERGA